MCNVLEIQNQKKMREALYEAAKSSRAKAVISGAFHLP